MPDTTNDVDDDVFVVVFVIVVYVYTLIFLLLFGKFVFFVRSCTIVSANDMKKTLVGFGFILILC